jgi:hypothetical protein
MCAKVVKPQRERFYIQKQNVGAEESNDKVDIWPFHQFDGKEHG